MIPFLFPVLSILHLVHYLMNKVQKEITFLLIFPLKCFLRSILWNKKLMIIILCEAREKEKDRDRVRADLAASDKNGINGET